MFLMTGVRSATELSDALRPTVDAPLYFCVDTCYCGHGATILSSAIESFPVIYHVPSSQPALSCVADYREGDAAPCALMPLVDGATYARDRRYTLRQIPPPFLGLEFAFGDNYKTPADHSFECAAPVRVYIAVDARLRRLQHVPAGFIMEGTRLAIDEERRSQTECHIFSRDFVAGRGSFRFQGLEEDPNGGIMCVVFFRPLGTRYATLAEAVWRKLIMAS